jgi:hypothetical protein
MRTVLIVLLMAGCAATTDATLMKKGKTYPPTTEVEILFEKPTRPYEIIAILDSKGLAGVSEVVVLNNMRDKAMQIGADALLPTGRSQIQHQQGIMYNPWLGGYQSVGGGTSSTLRGFAIKWVGATAPGTTQQPPATAGQATNSTNALEGSWRGTVTSLTTSQVIEAALVVKATGDAHYLGSNGVKIIMKVGVTGERVIGSGTMYMPADKEGRPIGKFPDGKPISDVVFSGQVSAGGNFSGTYSGGNDTGTFEFRRAQ